MRVAVVLMLVVLMLVSVVVGAPSVTQQQEPLHQTPDAQGRVWSAVSNLAAEFEKSIEKRVKDRDGTRRFDPMMIVHLLGFSDEDILSMLHSLEDTAAEQMSELSEEEKLKLENATLELVMMINNGSFQSDAGLSDLITIKSVLYPHLSPDNQATLDTLEGVITKLLKMCGYL